MTENDEYFFEKHEIPLSRVFNAAGYKRGEYQPIMRAYWLWIAYNASPCAREGHTLRTRAGHCAKCDPAKIAFMRRNDEGGDVYVLRSTSTGLVKVGCASDASERAKHLRASGYGGAHDWAVVYSSFVSAAAGKLEFEVHRRLRPFLVTTGYFRGDLWVDCRELFNCDLEIVVGTLKECLAA